MTRFWITLDQGVDFVLKSFERITIVIKADFHFSKRRFCETGNGCRPVAEDFEYNSADNPWRLTVDEMRDMIGQLEI